MKQSKQEVTSDIFFEASTAAALAMYKKLGKIPMGLSGLIKEGKDYNLIPIGDDELHHLSPDMAQIAIDLMLKPLVAYTNLKDHKTARPVVFFMSVAAEGGLKNENDEFEHSKLIITAARTEDQKGKTNTYKVEKNGFTKLTIPEDDVWQKKANDEDIPATLAQGLLDMLWKSYAVAHNMSLLNKTKEVKV
jgi:hypothetical protein